MIRGGPARDNQPQFRKKEVSTHTPNTLRPGPWWLVEAVFQKPLLLALPKSLITRAPNLAVGEFRNHVFLERANVS